MKQLFTIFLFGILSIIFLPLQAQFSVEGKVVAEDGSQALEYARVALLEVADSTVITGSVTNQDGNFKLEAAAGNYQIKVSILGYAAHLSKPFVLNETNTKVLLDIIKLAAEATTLDEVQISGEKSTMELALDKRIFNVGQDLANVGANASEILSNIPSVTVDPEGNVKLRGSSDVRILIDGKPSGLINVKGGEGLRQLQGSLIESIEVITNPSARYEAEGNAGVINIVLKKDRKQGFNGSFEATVGTPTNLGLAANINYRVKKLNFFVNYAFNYRVEPNIGSLYQEIYNGDTTLFKSNPEMEIEKV